MYKKIKTMHFRWQYKTKFVIYYYPFWWMWSGRHNFGFFAFIW